MRVVVIGLIGQYPFGGVVWDYIQYLTGFRKLGFDVHYLEDTGVWPYDPIKDSVTDDCSYHVGRLSHIMEAFGFSDKWTYRNAATGEFFGEGEKAARDLVAHADLLVGVSTAGWLEDYDIGVKHRMFIDGDPLFTQVRMATSPDDPYTKTLLSFDSHFSFGLCLGSNDCLAPTAGIHWKPTVQPVDLDHWQFAPNPHNGFFTTVMNWVSYKPVEWNGTAYGQKNSEFMKFLALPGLVPARFQLAMGQGIGRSRPTETIKQAGWQIIEPDEHIETFSQYHEFLSRSMAEWSIAKHGYVQARTGWFSCRTACYLAAGRPAIVQDTGWSTRLPHGAGLLPFSTMDDCVQGIHSIMDDYDSHRQAARSLAESTFEAGRVCRKLIEDASLS